MSVSPKPDLDETVRREQGVWASPDSLIFYQNRRTTPDDLYDSERFFLPKVLRKVTSCLDVGCAAGGFSQIMKSFNPALRYTGVDITPQFVEIARKTYPDSEFYVSDGIHFPFGPAAFELVHSSGVLHFNTRYREMLSACYAMTSRYLLVDFRLTRGPQVVGEIDVDFDGEGPKGKSLPYYVLNLDELMSLLKNLQPRPASIQARGYTHPPSATARIPLDRIIMGVFLIEKAATGDGTLAVSIDLPD